MKLEKGTSLQEFKPSINKISITVIFEPTFLVAIDKSPMKQNFCERYRLQRQSGLINRFYYLHLTNLGEFTF